MRLILNTLSHCYSRSFARLKLPYYCLLWKINRYHIITPIFFSLRLSIIFLRQPGFQCWFASWVNFSNFPDKTSFRVLTFQEAIVIVSSLLMVDHSSPLSFLFKRVYVLRLIASCAFLFSLIFTLDSNILPWIYSAQWLDSYHVHLKSLCLPFYTRIVNICEIFHSEIITF